MFVGYLYRKGKKFCCNFCFISCVQSFLTYHTGKWCLRTYQKRSIGVCVLVSLFLLYSKCISDTDLWTCQIVDLGFLCWICWVCAWYLLKSLFSLWRMFWSYMYPYEFYALGMQLFNRVNVSVCIVLLLSSAIREVPWDALTYVIPC